MKRPYQITGLVCLLFSVFLGRESLKLDYWSSGPGPGFFPFWLAVIFGVEAVVMLYTATFRGAEPMPPGFLGTRTGYLRLLAIILALSASVALIEPLGFRPTMLAFLVFLLFALGRSNPIVAGMVALGGSWGTFWVFQSLLKIPLPVGILGF